MTKRSPFNSACRIMSAPWASNAPSISNSAAAPGVKSVLVNNLQYRQAEEILMPPTAWADNVVLTLDLPIQRATERALRTPDPTRAAAAVVLDCRTGDVLAMASVPTFDPNIFTTRISDENGPSSPMKSYCRS